MPSWASLRSDINYLVMWTSDACRIVSRSCVCVILMIIFDFACNDVYLSDLLKHFVIFLVASNIYAMWSGLLVEIESCKFSSSYQFIPFPFMMILLWGGIVVMVQVRMVFPGTFGYV